MGALQVDKPPPRREAIEDAQRATLMVNDRDTVQVPNTLTDTVSLLGLYGSPYDREKRGST